VDYRYWANYLHQAARNVQDVEPITDIEKSLSVSDGYEIQKMIIDSRTDEGEEVIGVKAGLTSVAKQQAMGVDEPVYGFITDKMFLESGSKADLSQFIHPRVEPEIVFTLANDLSGSNITKEDVMEATESVCCGLEIIDSRYKDFRFTLADVVADNTSASGFVLGEKMFVKNLNLSTLGCLLYVNGDVVATATGAAVLDHPANAVALLANWLNKQGKSLKKGWPILSGGLTNAFPLKRNTTIIGEFAHLGSVSIQA
tara:strand:- start:183 stop:950 length:768 start_codon:yes stop_codon:yes gene_type:complete